MEFDRWNTIQARKKYAHMFFFLIFFLFIFFIFKIVFFNKSKRIAFVSNLSGASNKVFITNL